MSARGRVIDGEEMRENYEFGKRSLLVRLKRSILSRRQKCYTRLEGKGREKEKKGCELYKAH